MTEPSSNPCQLADDLPPLPEPDLRTDYHQDGWGTGAHSSDQMRAYAIAYGDARAAAERERLESDALRYRWLREADDDRYEVYKEHVDQWLDAAIDAAIRKGE